MVFKTKHRCPRCAISLNVNTDHDRYLACAFNRISNTKRLTSLTLKLDKLYTQPVLRDTIIHMINQYYNNNLVDDLPEYYPIPFNHTEMIKYTHLQDRFGLGHFLRGRISTSFHSPLNFRFNHLGKNYTSHFWFHSLISVLWDLHQSAWIDYCN